MKNEKGITLLALIIIVVVLIIIAGISIVVYRNGKNSGTSVEDIASTNEAALEDDGELEDEEEELKDPEIDVDAELADVDDSEIAADEERESDSVSEDGNRDNSGLDPDADVGDEEV